MMRVLLIGYDPETVDFSDPVFPAGMNAEKIRAGIAVAVEQFAARGWAGAAAREAVWRVLICSTSARSA